MTSTIAYCALIVSAGLVVALSAACPGVLSDQNGFLRNFVTHEFLNVLGVILAITLASAAQLHLKFNEIEEKYKRRGLVKTRAGVHRAAYFLIALFLGAVILEVIKPLLSAPQWAQSLFNGAAIVIIIWNVLILIAIAQTIFAIKAEIEDN